jgi:malate dehydrogenase (oxaloacetate-decarboxylating)
MDYYKESLNLHAKHKGKIEIISKVPLTSQNDLSISYTPGVAQPCKEIAKNQELVYKYTPKGNLVAVISDGSSILGLGNIGAKAAIPVMEGKAILLKNLANIDAFPITLESQNLQVNIQTIKNISPIFGGINLEDFKAPDCFELEAALQDIGIPVMHDDQHGTAVVVLAGMINALKLADKKIEDIKIVFNGAGSAGTAICKLLLSYGLKDAVICDSKGIIYDGRPDLKFNKYKTELSKITNDTNIKGNLADALIKADALIGVSVPDCITAEMIKSMNNNPIIFAMANPEPEINPKLAQQCGVFIIATGRSDYPNQVNNALAFPGIFRGALDARATRITEKMKLAAATALANSIEANTDQILPSPLDKNIVKIIAKAVSSAWKSN